MIAKRNVAVWATFLFYLLLGGVICKMGSFLPNWDLGYLAVISNFAVHISVLGAFWNFSLKLLV